MELTADGQADFAASTDMVSVRILGEPSQKFRDTYSITVSYPPIGGITR
ncbi:hypothetical protein [Actinacidiphila oryziradicis]|nr:hypothetical protein [Actinacidiphila oryziradicis]